MLSYTQHVILFGDRVFTEVIEFKKKKKDIIRVNPKPGWQVSLYRGQIRTQTEMQTAKRVSRRFWDCL
jgi:hypothetical protein